MGRYVSAWSEPEVHGGRAVRAFVVILRTGGCSWHNSSGGCLMCGYHEDTGAADADDIIDQFSRALERHRGEEVIKVYTSGSFLDPAEVPAKARDAVARMAFESSEHLLFESRPEYAKNIVELEGPSFEVAVGLESADDRVRALCVRKGFTFDDFTDAARTVHEAGGIVRTYLLLKPPYLSEREALEDAVASVRAASEHSDIISINPVNVQKGTVLEDLWRDAKYSPPWLWSLLEALGTEADARIISSPSGGGKARGVHNCGECDEEILSAVREFSMDGDARRLEGDCGCVEQWKAQLEVEHAAFRNGLDYRRSAELGTMPLPPRRF